MKHKERTPTFKTRKERLHMDARGRSWYGDRCPDCKVVYYKKYELRKQGLEILAA